MSDASTQSPKVGFASLGCPKASVDSKQIIAQLYAGGYEISGTYGGADLVVINTCGFIGGAVQESLDTIGEMPAENDKVIVTGCPGAKKDATGQDIITSIRPKVLAVTGPYILGEVMEAVRTHLPKSHDPFIDLVPPQGIKLTPKHYAYLKISEDYNHRCSFCITPSMHNDLVSHPVAKVMLGAENLLKAGVKELLVISRDTSAYGVDVKFRTGFWNGRPPKTRMTEPVDALDELASQYGARMHLHYVYPYPSMDEVMPLMAEGKVLPYLDVPLQHAHPDMLKRVRRPANAEKMLDRIRAWREVCPELTIHGTFITGFPSETEEEFQMLLDLIAETELDRVGYFAYSSVEGTTANDLPGALPDGVREGRRARFVGVAEYVPARRLQRKAGKSLRMLMDEANQDGSIGCSSTDTLEIGGPVYTAPPSKPYKHYKAGDLVSVKITGADGHDL